jgi:hypothetical protein
VRSLGENPDREEDKSQERRLGRRDW